MTTTVRRRPVVSAYFEPTEKETVSLAASLDGLGLSAFVRRAAVAAARSRIAQSGDVHIPGRPCRRKGGTEVRRVAFGVEHVTCAPCRRRLENT